MRPLGERVQRATERRDFEDLGYTVVLAPEDEYADTHAEFHVYRHEGYEKNPQSDEWDVPLFWRVGSSSNTNPTSHVANAETFLIATVKWDGCSNWNMSDAHLCGHEHLVKLTTLMERIWEWARAIGMDRLD